MKKIIIIGMALLSMAFYCNDAAATMMQVIAAGGGESGGGEAPASCDLLDYDAEGYGDETNITSAGWSLDEGTSAAVIDTDLQHGGSGSILIPITSTSYSVSKSFTAQSSGSFTISFWLRTAESFAQDTYFLSITDSAGTSAVAMRVSGVNYFVADNGSLTDTLFDFTPGTFSHLVFAFNMDTDTYTITIDDVQYLSGTTLNLSPGFNGDIAELIISTFTVTGTKYISIDDICVE